MKNKLNRYKLKLLPNTNKVSGWHIKQFIKEKGKSKGMIMNIIWIIGKHTGDGSICWQLNTLSIYDEQLKYDLHFNLI